MNRPRRWFGIDMGHIARWLYRIPIALCVAGALLLGWMWTRADPGVFRGHLLRQAGRYSVRYEFYDRSGGVQIIVQHFGSQPILDPDTDGMAMSRVGWDIPWRRHFDLLGLSYSTAQARFMRPPNPAVTDWSVSIPYWMPVTLLMVLPTVALMLTTRRRRIKPGHCPNCGYDLRATPDRCPECGAVPEAAKGATI